MIPATPGPKIPENGLEPEFRPEFIRNFEPKTEASSVVDNGGRWPFAGRFILPCTRAQNNVKVVGNREST